MRWIIGYIAALCVLLIVVAQSIFIPSFFMPYFSWHFERQNIPQDLNIEKDELMYVTTELLNYMRGRRDDMIIYARFNDGEIRQFFTDPVEIIHMVDVVELYRVGFLVRNIAFWLLLFLVFAMAFFKLRILEILSRCCREVIVGFLLLLVILAVVIAWDFDSAFVMFHLIFFDNNYWLLDPAVSYLLRMVPLIFFIEISIFVGLLLLLFSSFIIVASTLYLRMTVPKNETRIVAKFR